MLAKLVFITVFTVTLVICDDSFNLIDDDFDEPALPEEKNTIFFEKAATAALLTSPKENPFEMLEGITVPAAHNSNGGTIVINAHNKPVNMDVLINLGNRQLYIPGLVRVFRAIHANLLVTHGPFLATDLAECAPGIQNEVTSICEKETKDILPKKICLKVTDIFASKTFKGQNIFDSKVLPSFVGSVAEQAIPTQYTPNLPIADTYLKIKEWADLKPIDLENKKINQHDLTTLDSLCSNAFEFASKNGNMCKAILAVYGKFFVDYNKYLGQNLARLDEQKPKWSKQFASMLAKGADGWLTDHMVKILDAPEDVYTAFVSTILLSIHTNNFDTSQGEEINYPCGHPSAPNPCQAYHPCGHPQAPNPCLPAPCGHPLAQSPCSPCQVHLLGCHSHLNKAALMAHYKALMKKRLEKPPTNKPTDSPTVHPSSIILPPTFPPTTPRPTSKPTTVPTATPTPKPTTASPTKPPTKHPLCAQFAQGCPCGHPSAPNPCTPCQYHPIGCPCGHPQAPVAPAHPCTPCNKHLLGCNTTQTAAITNCPCARLTLTAQQTCPCAAQVVAQNCPPVGSTTHHQLLSGAHAAAKAAAAAVLKKGGSKAEANKAAATAHANHIAAHSTAAATAHKLGQAILKAGGTQKQADQAVAAHYAAHLAQHVTKMTAKHGVGSAEHKAAIAAQAHHHVTTKTPVHITQVNHFDTGVDEVTPCLISPPLCHHGKCVDKQAHHYVCICEHGWAGNNCEIPLTAVTYGQITQLAFNLPFFTFNVPFSAVSNKRLDASIFESQIKRDLSVALGVEPTRFIIKGMSPSADGKYTVVTINVTPPTTPGELTTQTVQRKMKEWMLPTLAPELAKGIATRHLFVPGTGTPPRFKAKHLGKALEHKPKSLHRKFKNVSSRAVGSIMGVLCLQIFIMLSW